MSCPEQKDLHQIPVEDWPLINRLAFYALIALNSHTWPGVTSAAALESDRVQKALEKAYEQAANFNQKK